MMLRVETALLQLGGNKLNVEKSATEGGRMER